LLTYLNVDNNFHSSLITTKDLSGGNFLVRDCGETAVECLSDVVKNVYLLTAITVLIILTFTTFDLHKKVLFWYK
jgi:hypothetical protein